jgi:hypothetical protein
MNDVFARPVGRDANSKLKGCSLPVVRPRIGPVLTYGIGAIVGGATVGVLFYASGAALLARERHGVTFAATLVVSLAVLLEFRGRLRPLPELGVQVPSRWLRWRNKKLTAAAYGLVLGGGIFTYLHHATAYVFWIVVAFGPSQTAALLLGGLYGAQRGAMLAKIWWTQRLPRIGPATPHRNRRLDWRKWDISMTLGVLAVATFCLEAAVAS